MSKKKNRSRLENVSPPPDVARIAQGLRRQANELTTEELAEFDKRFDEAYPGGFSARDEANALIAMAVRNGPIEELHAGKHSEFLDDHSLSRITDEEMKIIMINATRALAALLHLRETDPKLYQRWLRSYGMAYCQHWEREP